MGKYMKLWMALIGGAATATVTAFGGDTTVGKCAAIVLAAVTAAAVYVAPNDPPAKP
jgi:hypothetical protein